MLGVIPCDAGFGASRQQIDMRTAMHAFGEECLWQGGGVVPSIGGGAGGTKVAMRPAATIIAFAFAIALAASGPAGAQGVGLRVGTLGAGGDIGWGIAPTLSARVGYSALDFGATVNTDDVRYDGRVKLSNLSGLLDWSPAGPFRLTAGLVGTNNRVSVSATPSGSIYTINGTTYQASDVGGLSGMVEPGNRIAPYLGIGYGKVAGAGVNFYFDLGVIYQGSPNATLTGTCGAAMSSAQCTQFQSDVAAERYSLERSLNKYKLYPVGQVGITIGF